MTRLLFVLINQVKYYAQDTGNQYCILGRLICLPDCDKTSENEIYISSPFSNQGLPAVTSDEFLLIHPKPQCLHIVYTIITAIPT